MYKIKDEGFFIHEIFNKSKKKYVVYRAKNFASYFVNVFEKQFDSPVKAVEYIIELKRKKETS